MLRAAEQMPIGHGSPSRAYYLYVAIQPPQNYAAYALRPSSFEFYSGGHPGYVNDRFLFLKDGSASWSIRRLQG